MFPVSRDLFSSTPSLSHQLREKARHITAPIRQMCDCVVGWSYCRSAVCDRKYPETTPRAIKGSISVRNTTGQLENKASGFAEI